MKRRNFFIKTGLGAAAIIVAPKLLCANIPEKELYIEVINHITGQTVKIPCGVDGMSIIELHRALQSYCDEAYMMGDENHFLSIRDSNPSKKISNTHIILKNGFDVTAKSVSKLDNGVLEIEHTKTTYASVKNW